MKDDDDDRRRSPRLWTSVWVALDGLDAELQPRSLNLSATGMYFEYDQPVGDAGTVQWLYLSSADRIISLQIMACVVRSDALPSGKLWGLALEFMPESDEAIVQLRDFLHYVLALASDGVRASDVRPTAAKTGVRSVVLETEFALPVGEPVRVEVIARGVSKTLRLEGRAIRSVPIGGDDGRTWHRVEVAVQRGVDGPLRRFSAQGMQAVRVVDKLEGPQRKFTPSRGIPFAKGVFVEPEVRDAGPAGEQVIDNLLGAIEIRHQPNPEARSHLAGELTRIRLPTLLSMIDMERMTGELVVSRDRVQCTLFCRNGQVVALEPLSLDVRADIGRMMKWEDGQFAFTVKPVERVDVVHTKTTALLLDLAREEDEQQRDQGDRDFF